ncbi:MAG: hypothetical protein ABIR84_09540, partial [Candidatus Nitrotoga sp.]
PVMAAHLYPTSAVNHTRTVSFARGSCVLNRGLIGRLMRHFGREENHKVSPGHPFLLHQLRHPPNIWLTQRFKTLQSP